MGNITVINLTSCGYEPQPLPQENIIYSAFDDEFVPIVTILSRFEN